MEITKESIIKCRYCKVEQQVTMPENSCQIAYECSACGGIMTKREGDCCVFCSYGSVKCPSVQKLELKK